MITYSRMEYATLVPVISGLAGVAVGGIIGEAREWLKLARDRRRTLNRVLYVQLDVWHLVLRADPDAVKNVIPRALASVFGAPAGDLAAFFAEQPTLHTLVVDMINEAIPEDLEGRYQSAVNQLAEVDPVMAYRLSGRPQLTAVAQTWRSRVESMLVATNASEEDRSIFAKVRPSFDREARKQLVGSLEEDIEDVSRKLGHLQWRSVRQQMQKEKNRLSAKNEVELHSLLHRVLMDSGLISQTAS